MNLKLNLQNNLLNEEDINRLSQEICQTINSETDSEAELSSKQSGPGSKGDATVIGEIIMTALSSGTITALFNIIKNYINRDSKLSVDLTGKNGNRITINAENIKSRDLNDTISQLKILINE